MTKPETVATPPLPFAAKPAVKLGQFSARAATIKEGWVAEDDNEYRDVQRFRDGSPDYIPKRSDLATICKTSAGHLRAQRTAHDKAPAAGLNIQIIKHAAFLEPDKFRERIIQVPETSRKPADWKKAKEATASKAFTCEFCGHVIEKGDKNLVLSAKRIHPECIADAPADPWRDILADLEARGLLVPGKTAADLDASRNDAWYYVRRGWYLVKDSQLRTIENIRQALAAHIIDGTDISALDLLSGRDDMRAAAEVSGYGMVDLVDVAVRPDARFDKAPGQLIGARGWREGDGLIVDLKNSVSADPARWPFICRDYWYHLQPAIYCDVAANIDGRDYRFLWVVVENEYPHAVSVIEPSPEDFERGRKAYRKSLQKYSAAMSSGVWPMYPTAITMTTTAPIRGE